MRRTTHLKAVAALSAVALLAACGGDADEAAEETTSAVESEDMGGETSDDMAGETTEAPAAGGDGEGNTSDTFTFGYILPETGQLAFLGPPQISGLGLAIEDINAAGGVLGNEVPEAIAGDEAGQDTVAQASADRILSEDVSAIVGAAASGMSLAVIDRITGAGVMQCSGSNTAPTFTDYEDDGLYIRTAPSDALQGPILANTIVNDGWTNVAIIARADDYGRGLADATAADLENAGATVALNETYDPGATEFNAAVESVVSAEPDAVVVIAFEEGAQILQGLFEAGLTPDQVGVYGADGLRSADLGSIVNESDPTIIAGMKGTAPASANNPDFLDRLAEFDPELGENVQFAPQIYDCAVTMALAAEAAGSVNAQDFKAEVNNVTQGGTECTTFEECRDLLADGEDIDYNGVSGPLDFTDVGEPGRATIEVYEFDDEGALQSIETVESNPSE
jgi:ABC-type branched-subunit amino acid transport system substrate-binding protein